MSEITIDIPRGADGYATFIKCKSLPSYRVSGRVVITDAQSYASVFGADAGASLTAEDAHLFDYQRFVVNLALERQRYAAFLDCGLGKTAIEMAWAHAVAAKVGRVLFVCPLAVLEDVQRFCDKFYGYRMSNLRSEPWKTDIAIINTESLRDPAALGRFAGIVLDESSVLKGADSESRKWLTELAIGTKYRLAASATPSPNEQAEYATHAVWLGYSTTLNEFYGQFFRKDGNDWRLKGHARDAFYRNLRAWCCYIQSPSLLGFSDCQAEMKDPPNIVEIDTECLAYKAKGTLFAVDLSLKDSQGVFGAMRSDRTQLRFNDAAESVAGKHAIVWCSRNSEEAAFHDALGGHVVSGATPIEERVEKIDDWRAGRVKILVSKPKVLGFGVNLPEATDMLYSGYTYSFEQFYQAVRRAHRFGRVGRLNVHVPITDIERPVWEGLRQKMRTFDADVQKLQEDLRA